MLLAERAEEVAWFVEELIREREADLEDLAIATEPVIDDPVQLATFLDASNVR